MAKYDNILQTIGRTPLVRIRKLAPECVKLYVKVESFNPMGSVKDRMALAVIEQAERSGELKPGQTVIEATSGNTGIGLAMVCAQRGYPLVIVMAENFSIERRKMLRFLGAKVVLTPASEKGTGMLNKAVELARAHGYYLCRQFENDANAEVHTRTTARELLDDFCDEPLDYFVSGFGTGGTLLGVARGLKGAGAPTRIVAAEPDNSPVLASGIAQPRTADGAPSGSHPKFRPHLMQGWSPDFVSRLTESAVAENLVDEIVPVAGDDAIRTARALARLEGIFVGTSGGATLAAALAVARRAPVGSNIVCMLPDTGERYLSTPLFEGIGEEMDEAEIELSRSTPGYRFDSPAACPAVSRPVRPMHAPDPAADAMVTTLVRDEPVLLFALEWCEFCWSVRKLFKRMGIAYRSVDLDSVAYQADDMGGKIRAVLAQRTGSPTIPQIYMGGEHIGGCTELFDAVRDGSLQRRLAAGAIDYDTSVDIDPYSLFPKWLQPRKTA
ncbi:cysteine synthase A [Aromatoleum petrolei]|uniref:cysteine synthase n=1 Tax=Aromatoleum petrolei TaxID=76116 RepID=A0ABX1MZB6_9RHOO|nr:cysteine synthase A [Aromatoleum petrolei]NMF91254.1 cysteine synthase A [Aromatoleum petrolei]QTQ38373.1 Cysteine synthase [Aromatoleum petrolei]